MCSTVIFGKNRFLAMNYDYNLDHGLVSINLKDKYKSNGQQDTDRAVDWRVQFGSVTFNQFSLELPVSGMNETGLAVSLLWHEQGACGNDSKLYRLNPLQWVQYQLDNFQSVEEVVEALKTIRPEQGPIPLHFVVLDALGNNVFVEFVDGELKLYQNTENSVLTNSTYADCIECALSGTTPEHLNANSFARFDHLYRERRDLDDSATVENGFELLDSVSQTYKNGSSFPWNSDTNSNTITAWSIVFDTTDKVISLKSCRNRALREFRLSDCRFESDDDDLIMDINAGVDGSALPFFSEYSRSKNEIILQLSVSNLGLPDSMVNDLAEAVDRLYCQ